MGKLKILPFFTILGNHCIFFSVPFVPTKSFFVLFFMFVGFNKRVQIESNTRARKRKQKRERKDKKARDKEKGLAFAFEML